MAISINWGTRVIFVPKDYTTLVQLSPNEIRDLDSNQFHLDLRDLEDNENGIPNPDTHFHQTELTFGGVTYARIIIIINGYTVTFEDGQYAVQIQGANTNIADVTNVNQVSVRSFNSAGLVATYTPEEISLAVLVGVIEGSVTLQQSHRAMLAALVGKSSGGDTSNIKFRDTQDSVNRIDENVDEDGNRLSVTLDLD
jgi:hypothetical protein